MASLTTLRKSRCSKLPELQPPSAESILQAFSRHSYILELAQRTINVCTSPEISSNPHLSSGQPRAVHKPARQKMVSSNAATPLCGDYCESTSAVPQVRRRRDRKSV